MDSLPIAALLPELIERMRQSPRLILTAPPGSGKTTAVPLALLESDWLGRRKLLVVEPRRLATRAAANRMADLRGEAVGESVGYRMRLESRCGPGTRIEVVTEGLFTRMIQSDPELAGVGAVLFDEYHERSLDADLGLALTLDVQASLRPDLRILLMSATLEDARLREALGAPVVSADVRGHPVGIEYLGGDARQPLAGRVVAALRRVWAQHPGHVLVFLPGLGEIRQVQRQLDGAALPGASVMPLHGSLPRSEQLRALEPDTSVRKIVLASAVAETSLTIDGVGVVIDAGLSRQPRFDLARGLTRLETVRASRASAEQRRGRAGRTGPGHCVRLWAESEQSTRPAHGEAEILRADLLPLALELASWGVDDAGSLFWLDPPPATGWQAAREQLRTLDAVDADGRLSAAGRAMAATGLTLR